MLGHIATKFYETLGRKDAKPFPNGKLASEPMLVLETRAELR